MQAGVWPARYFTKCAVKCAHETRGIRTLVALASPSKIVSAVCPVSDDVIEINYALLSVVKRTTMDGMTAENFEQVLRSFVRRQPFQPFRLVLTTGEAYDIRHPDLIMVGERSIAIGITNDANSTVFDRLVRADGFVVAARSAVL